MGFAICKKSQVSLTDVRFATYAAFGPNESMPNEVVHGPSRREMQQLFQRHINKRAYRKSICLWSTYVSRQKLRIHAVTICVNKDKTTLLDGTLSCWSFEADKTLSNKVIKFIHSLQMSLRTKCFSCGENLHINKKS